MNQASYISVLRHPAVAMTLLLLICALAAAFATRLTFDAGSETLVVEGDPEFAEYVALGQRFPSDDYLFITVTPRPPLFEPRNLQLIQELQQDIDKLPGVLRTLSIATVPILRGDGTTSLTAQPELLEDAEAYFRGNRMFAGQLVSEDGNSAAIQTILQSSTEGFTQQDRAQLIADLRALREDFADRAELEFAGVPLIAHDMMAYLRADVRNFGIAAALMIGAALFIFFRRLRWVVLCASNATMAIILVVGLLGALGTPISVVSGNFISLLAIISISLTIHLVVRFRELMRTHPEQEHFERVRETMYSKFAPCFYTAATTIVAFTSLLTSGIPPVEDFGWMMAVGVVCAFIVTYVFFPCMLLLLGPGKPSKTLHKPMRLSIWLGVQAQRLQGRIVLGAFGIALLAGLGIAQLSLNSHFSQYFKSDSDIRRGLEFVDAQFGGVLPLDIVVTYAPFEEAELSEDDDFFFEDSDSATAEFPQSAWFSSSKVSELQRLTDYLIDRADVGSAISFAQLAELAANLNENKALDDVQLALMVTLLGAGRESLLGPYANPESGEMRITVRMREQTATAEYQTVVNELEQFAEESLNITSDRVATTGMFVLFGQSIRQLYESQRDTLIYVVIATLIMFIVLLRSVALGLVALSVNLLAAACVLAHMGYAGIPMDMMTITIAAITIGIGVDDAFHYLHRYREERSRGQTPTEAVTAVHASIGRAIYFTSVTVIAGFSLLALSNFVPTIYFGMLTAMAMAIALLANLLLLPALLLLLERWRTSSTAMDSR